MPDAVHHLFLTSRISFPILRVRSCLAVAIRQSVVRACNRSIPKWSRMNPRVLHRRATKWSDYVDQIPGAGKFRSAVRVRVQVDQYS